MGILAKTASGGRILRLLGVGAVASTLAVGIIASGTSATASATSGTTSRTALQGSVQLTAAERAAWREMTETAAGRAEVVSALSTAFHGVARVTTVDPAVRARKSVTVNPDLAYGITNDHFWIVASYWDIASGAVNAAVRACSYRLPSWLCNAAGSALKYWGSGWGWANNHGVWVAIYWWPPHYTGGRW